MSSAAGRLPLGTELRVKAAYETSKGNPFRAYDVNDFQFGHHGIDVAVTGADVLAVDRNELSVRLAGADVDIRVIGFDINRDVQVRVMAKRPPADSLDEVIDAAG